MKFVKDHYGMLKISFQMGSSLLVRGRFQSLKLRKVLSEKWLEIKIIKNKEKNIPFIDTSKLLRSPFTPIYTAVEQLAILQTLVDLVKFL